MLKKVAIFLIRLYQNTVSVIFPSVCRFYPTCSQYTLEAIEYYGIVKGTTLGVKRISKCHPSHPGGIDLLTKEGPHEFSSH